MLASLMSRLAERWFGGYTMGSGLVYGALFQIFWRGNSFEFFTGTLTWSLIMMTALFFAGRRLKLLVATPLPNVERPPAPDGKSLTPRRGYRRTPTFGPGLVVNPPPRPE